MHLIVGLGNPGPKYARHRHNVGFMAADRIVAKYGLRPTRRRFHSEVYEGEIAGARILLLKPQTFMNDSGRAVLGALAFHKLGPADVVVVHDEIDLALGKVRAKRGGGAAGHNGIKSIDGSIGRNYRRVRIGVGHPGGRALVHGHVLDEFEPDEAGPIDKTLDAVVEALPILLQGDEPAFMTKVALLSPRPRKAPDAEDGATDR
jgi:PTH1 family peptidyl-tRNA hydrolase